MATYRKIRAAKLFTGITILEGDKVLICQADGTVEDIVEIEEAGDGIEFFPGMISPGFVNAHCHLDLSHLKNEIPHGTGLVNFVQQVMAKRNEKSLEEKLEAMENAAEEMVHAGIIAVGDICNGVESIPVKLKSLIDWKNFVEIGGFVDNTALQRLEQGLKTEERFIQKGMHAQVVPHSPYSVSKSLFGLINEHSSGQLISIHNQEAAAENELYKNKSGELLKLYDNLGIDISGFEASCQNSLPSWLPHLNNQQSIISVHNSFSSKEDIFFAKNYAVDNLSALHFCICINANLYIENTLPPIEMLLEQSCNIIIGTDSYASNNQLSIWEEIKTIQKNFTAFKLETILGWATMNSARALRLDDKLGSFEKGKTPGIVHIYDNVASRIL
ncbi:MAG: amidohydrolase family protein [Ferruginibacter sp.]